MNTERVIKKLKNISDLFRLGRPLEVTTDLITLLEEIVIETSGKKSNGFHSIEDIFSLILCCQESEDWLGLADYLEYELSNLLIYLSQDEFET